MSHLFSLSILFYFSFTSYLFSFRISIIDSLIAPFLLFCIAFHSFASCFFALTLCSCKFVLEFLTCPHFLTPSDKHSTTQSVPDFFVSLFLLLQAIEPAQLNNIKSLTNWCFLVKLGTQLANFTVTLNKLLVISSEAHSCWKKYSSTSPTYPSVEYCFEAWREQSFVWNANASSFVKNK